MNIQPVTGQPFTYNCLFDGARHEFDPTHPAFADLDGEPFKAYYCPEHVSCGRCGFERYDHPIYGVCAEWHRRTVQP